MAAYGTMPAQRVLLRLFLLLICLVFVAASTISDLRKCADKKCSVTLSRATAMARYPSSSPLHLSLNRGDIVEIKSKSAGNRPELWGGEINGRRGYFPKAFVREFDVRIDNPIIEVPTEENVWSKQPPQQQQQQKQPPPAQQQPPPPVVPEAVKDETEIDETDLTDLDDGDAETVPEDEAPSTDPSSTQEEKDTLEEPAEEGEAKEEEKALNNFLSKQFASAPEGPDTTEDDKTQTTEDTSTQESEENVPDVGKDVDETDIDGSDSEPATGGENAAQPKTDETKDEPVKEEKNDEDSPYIPGVRVLEDDDDDDEGEVDIEEEDNVVQEEETVPEKADEKSTETTEKADEKSTETAEKTEQKPADTVQSSSTSTETGDTETRAEDPTEIVEEEEREDEAENSVKPLKTDSGVEGEEKPQAAQDNLVDPSTLDTRQDIKQTVQDTAPQNAQQDVVKQTVHDTAPPATQQQTAQETVPLDTQQGVKQTTHDTVPQVTQQGVKQTTHDTVPQATQQDVKQTTQNTVPQEAPALPAADQKPVGSEHTEDTGMVDSVDRDSGHPTGDVPLPDAGSSTTGDAASTQETAEEKLLFQSGLEKAGEGPAVKDFKDSPAVMNMDTLDALSKVQQGEAETEKHADERVPLGHEDSEGQGTKAGQQPDIQPDRTVSKPSGSFVATGHQPVDIDFVAEQGQAGDAGLESSERVEEQLQPTHTHTPALEATPGLAAKREKHPQPW